MELLSYLALAFLGGVILNLMPCVLPVLTLKVYHLVEHGAADASTHRKHGVAYTAGIVLSFIVFAAIVSALRASGQAVGWGMQFQNPAFVAALVILMVAFGLNALGVFEISVNVAADAGPQGLRASFMNGVVAAVMSTPCSAPFLGAAVSFALAKDTSPAVTVALFATIGLGLALPFTLVSFVPGLGRRLPKPGAWMETFKHLMGFSLLAAAVWLYGVLLNQVTPDAALWTLAFILAVSLGLWMVGRFAAVHHAAGQRLGVRLAVIAGLVLLGGRWLSLDKSARASETGGHEAPVVKDGHIQWAGFSPTRVELERRRQRPVFMDYTADWCANCKTNEKVFLETEVVRSTLVETGILPMKADWTNDDETIGKWLEELGRSGIPAYVIYYPDGTRDLLPEVITAEMVVDRLNQATAKWPKSAYKPLEDACLAAAAPKPAEATISAH